MHQITSDPVLRFVEVSSATKDTLIVTWMTNRDPHRSVTGYRIGYQAIGSSVIQFIQNLRPMVNLYEITNLHENTVYNVCVEALTNASASGDLPWGTLCVTGATSSESLTVVLGSTVGAFLALAVVVSFVALAKWQHLDRRRKRSQLMEKKKISVSGEQSIDDCRLDEEMVVTTDGRSVDGLSPVLVFVDDQGLEGSRICFASASSLVLDGGQVSVAELDGGQKYGLLLPLSRATELLPLVIADGSDGVISTGCDRGRDRRKRLQKYKTVDHGSGHPEDQCGGPEKQRLRHGRSPRKRKDECDESCGPEPGFHPQQQQPEQDFVQTEDANADDYANEINTDQVWLYRSRSLSI